MLKRIALFILAHAVLVGATMAISSAQAAEVCPARDVARMADVFKVLGRKAPDTCPSVAADGKLEVTMDGGMLAFDRDGPTWKAQVLVNEPVEVEKAEGCDEFATMARGCGFDHFIGATASNDGTLMERYQAADGRVQRLRYVNGDMRGIVNEWAETLPAVTVPSPVKKKPVKKAAAKPTTKPAKAASAALLVSPYVPIPGPVPFSPDATLAAANSWQPQGRGQTN